jgi:hypothetical protein
MVLANVHRRLEQELRQRDPNKIRRSVTFPARIFEDRQNVSAGRKGLTVCA